MSNCNLSQYTTYPLNSVKHDVAGERYVVTLQSPPATCPDGLFISHSARLVVAPVPTPLLGYDAVKHRPVVTVASEADVQEINKPEGWGFWTWEALLLLLGVVGWWMWWRHREDEAAESAPPPPEPLAPRPMAPLPSGGAPRAVRAPAYTPRYLAPPPAPVVVHNSNDGFLTGMLVGNMLSGPRTEVIHEREVVREQQHVAPPDPAPDFGGTFSSDNSGSAFSSDSDSGFSSDGGSFSGDSGFSSDGGSFGSDGGSFSSD